MASVLFTIALIASCPVIVHSIRGKINVIFLEKRKETALIPHILVTLVICTLGVVASVLVPDLSTVFVIAGTTSYPISAFVLPTYFVWTLVPKQQAQHRAIKVMSLGVLAVVAAVSVASFYKELISPFLF